MSATHQPTDLDLFGLRDQLEAAGWDAIASELTGEVAARQEHPPTGGVWALSIDRSGRMRFVATREMLPPESRLLACGGREYRLLRKSVQITNITSKLESPADLPAVLAQLQGLALKHVGKQSSEPQGGTPWDQNQETPDTTSDF